MENLTSELPTNASSQAEEHCPFEEVEESSRIIKAIAYCIVMLLSLVGNSIVLYIFRKHRSMRTTTNRLIVNMAASDLLLPILVLPRHLSVVLEKGEHAALVWRIEGILGEITCKLIPFLGDVSNAVSIFSLVLIAVDRYLAVVWPMSKGLHFTRFRCNLLIAGTWLVASALHAPYFHTFHLLANKYCLSQWRRGFDAEAREYNFKIQQIYFVSVFIVVYAIPLTLITVLYTSIILELGEKTRQNSDKNVSAIGRRRKREDRRVVSMLVVVLSVFALLFAPSHVYHFVKFFVWSKSPHCGYPNLEFANLFLAQSTCCITPYIYFIFVRNYRHGFKEVLRCCCRVELQQSSQSHEDAQSRNSSRFTSDLNTNSTSIRSGRVTSGRGYRFLHAAPCCIESARTTPHSREPALIQFESCL